MPARLAKIGLSSVECKHRGLAKALAAGMRYTMRLTLDSLCRRCHSSFTFIVDLERKNMAKTLIEYWYPLILAQLFKSHDGVQSLVFHLIKFYEIKPAERHQSASI